MLADGTIIQTGSKNRKDTTGLDIKDLVIGSEGTLAVITKCLLKLVGKPESSASLLISYDSLKAGIESVPLILKANINPTAVEFIERKVVEMGEKFLNSINPAEKNIHYPDADCKAYLLITFDGSRAEIDAAILKLKEIVKNISRGVFVLNGTEQSANIWRVRGCLVKSVEAVSEQEPLDIVVPISQVDKFVEYVNSLESETGMQMISFGHAGDGNVHLCVVRGSRSEEAWQKELHENLKKLYEHTHSLGGLISGEHGLGVSKREFFFGQTPQENVALMNAIKQAFDPEKILNRKISYVK